MGHVELKIKVGDVTLFGLVVTRAVCLCVGAVDADKVLRWVLHLLTDKIFEIKWVYSCTSGFIFGNMRA